MGRDEGPRRAPPPSSVDELCERAARLEGLTVGEVAAFMRFDVGVEGVHTKGKVGELVERALGASGGAGAMHDFPALGVELKTLPLDGRARPVESTFVCAISVAQAETASWETSWARAKLSRVLWVPFEGEGPMGARKFHRPFLWVPSAAEEATLKADHDELMGRIGAGGIEGLTARVGVALQVRPKAAHGRVRTVAFGAEGEPIETVPRGFYLRASFTVGLLEAARGAGASRR